MSEDAYYTSQEILPDGGSEADRMFVLDRKRGEQWPQEPVLLGELEDLRVLEREVARILRPTAGQLYEATLHGFDETGGDVESPTGWFARLDWPNGIIYLITNDELGNVRLIAQAAVNDGDARNQLMLKHQELIDRYDAWTDIEEQEM